jgi:2-aminobenzoate-CoA ligase
MWREGSGDRVVHPRPDGGLVWTYAELQAQANRIAQVLVHDMGLVPGNRVLLRAPNNPMLAACWFGVIKAGGIAVGTMPLLRAKELGHRRQGPGHARAVRRRGWPTSCTGRRRAVPVLRRCATSTATVDERRMRWRRRWPPERPLRQRRHRGRRHLPDRLHLGHHRRAQGDDALPPRRDGRLRLLAAARAAAPADDVFIGSPPLAFTFGLGGLLLFPMTIGRQHRAAGEGRPDALLPAIARHRATVCFTAPTSYRAMAAQAAAARPAPLRKCVSAGEALPAATRALWKQATGIELIDGIGATELLHIFISADEAHARPAPPACRCPATAPAWSTRPASARARPAPWAAAVQGPTGCRYLDDARQAGTCRAAGTSPATPT